MAARLCMVDRMVHQWCCSAAVLHLALLTALSTTLHTVVLLYCS